MKKIIFMFVLIFSVQSYAADGPICNPGSAALLLAAGQTKTFTRKNWITNAEVRGQVTFTPGSSPCSGTVMSNTANFLSTTSGTNGNYEVAFTAEFVTPSKGVKRMLILTIFNAAANSTYFVWQDANGEPHLFLIGDDGANTNVYEFDVR